jgi:hypothetical protein
MQEFAADTATGLENGERTMNANEMTFGIEIETHMPAGSVYPGNHGCGRQVDWLPAGWLADADPSIITPSSSRVACEFVSPVLAGADGLRQVVEVIAEIKRRGGQVNASCGLHVHVGFDKRNTPAVGRLISLVSNHEKALYAVTGTRSREQGVGSRYRTCWCKSVKQYGNKSAARHAASRDRYHLLNLATSKPTVEFRVFGASLNADKVCAYVRLCVGLAEKALVSKKSAAWNASNRPTSKSNFGLGEGATAGVVEATRLLFSLGWLTRGGAHGFPVVTADGQTAYQKSFGVIEGEGIPTMIAARKELARLADKYDTAPAV